MRSINKNDIQTYIEKFTFSDNSTISSRTSDIIIRDQNITFVIDIKNIDITEAEIVKDKIINQLKKQLKDEYQVKVILTSTKTAENKQKHLHIEGIKEIIVVIAGKGGVGKSTISSLLAQKLAAQNKKIGLLDADIYGPSIPHIFGINTTPEIENKMMIPIYKHNVYINSIGFIAPQDKAISWRGPMLSKALYQLISLTKWDNLDYLIIDMPPGTGDIHLSLLQNYHVNKAMIVTTPQKISEIDVVRTIDMYQGFDVPIHGVVENMSYYIDTDSGKKNSVFSGDSGTKIANQFNVKQVSQIPIIPALSKACDTGTSLKPWLDLVSF